MREFIKLIVDLLNEFFGAVRDKERNAETKQHVADARERADERLKNSTTADRNARLTRLSRNRPDHSSDGGRGDADLDRESPTDPGHKS